MTHRNIFGVAGLAVLLLATAACSAEQTGAEPSGGARDRWAVDAAAAPDPQAISKVNEFLKVNGPAEQARQVIVQGCMNAAGFEWTPVPVRSDSIEDLLGLKPLSVEDARTKGYAREAAAGGEEPVGGNVPGAQEAFAGSKDAPQVSVEVFGMHPTIASDGCLAQSYKVVYGSIENGMMATGVSSNALLPSVNAAIFDQTMMDTYKVWQKCMEESGRPNLATPDLAWDEARKHPELASSIALADAKCRESINFEETRKAALNKYLTTFLSSEEAMITEIQEIRQSGARNAQKILAGE